MFLTLTVKHSLAPSLARGGVSRNSATLRGGGPRMTAATASGMKATLETLQFDNTFVRDLPGDPISQYDKVFEKSFMHVPVRSGCNLQSKWVLIDYFFEECLLSYAEYFFPNRFPPFLWTEFLWCGQTPWKCEIPPFLCGIPSFRCCVLSFSYWVTDSGLFLSKKQGRFLFWVECLLCEVECLLYCVECALSMWNAHILV